MKYFLNIECLVRKEKTKIIRSLLLDKIRLTSVGKNYLDEIIRNEKTKHRYFTENKNLSK